MNRQAKIACPYCRKLNAITIGNDWEARNIVTCDPEAGGCDKFFLVKTEVELKFTTYIVAEVKNDFTRT